MANTNSKGDNQVSTDKEITTRDRILGQVQIHLAQAQWWMNSATNGHAGTRIMLVWDEKLQQRRPMTAEELRDDAMQTSKRHMQIARDMLGV